MKLLKKLSALLSKKEEPEYIPETYDLTNRYWGHNYEILEANSPYIRLAVWMPNFPRPNDYLLLQNEKDSTRYRVLSIKYCYNPSDMAFINAEFAPRD